MITPDIYAFLPPSAAFSLYQMMLFFFLFATPSIVTINAFFFFSSSLFDDYHFHAFLFRYRIRLIYTLSWRARYWRWLLHYACLQAFRQTFSYMLWGSLRWAFDAAITERLFIFSPPAMLFRFHYIRRHRLSLPIRSPCHYAFSFSSFLPLLFRFRRWCFTTWYEMMSWYIRQH